MTAIHSTVGTLLILGYLIVLALNIRTAMGKPRLSFQRPLSFTAATLYLIQIMLGFSLLGEGKDISAVHYLVALLGIFSIGAEHALGGKEVNSVRSGRIGAIANVVTVVVVLVAYIIGETNS